MSAPDLLGGVILAALVLYALLGGADFGGGIWDLLASGPRVKEQRALIERAIGPIWEANHVWLILVVVLLFTGFPAAFARISIALFTPLVLLLVGIVLRGAAFTFRTYDYPEDVVQRRWGVLFSGASILAPLMLGAVVGALAAGWRAGSSGAGAGHWLSAFSAATGVFAAALFAYLAATYLAVEAEGPLRDDFRRRAIGAGVAVFVCAALVAAISAREAPLVFEGLTRRPFTLPLHLATGAAAVVAFVALAKKRVRAARTAAALQVALIVVGWGASQYPYLVPPDLTVGSAAGPRATLVPLLWALGAGALLLFPALYLLFRIFKGERPFAIVDRPRTR